MAPKKEIPRKLSVDWLGDLGVTAPTAAIIMKCHARELREAAELAHAAAGRRGGQRGVGTVKARTSEQARAAVAARWARAKAKLSKRKPGHEEK
jgi:hypothetical protein